MDDAAHIIVFGNEKGGSGKSTSAMHVAVSLLRLGYRVGTIDLDARQGTLTRYMKNRWAFIERSHHEIPLPLHMDIEQSKASVVEDQEKEERDFLMLALADLGTTCDFIVIDTPGAHNHLSRLAHSYADTLVTPLNDSFVDLDLLGRIDPETYEVTAPSVYTLMVEEQNVEKVTRGGTPVHWIVMRNRLSHLKARNKQKMALILDKMALMFGFQMVSGFGDRVVFKELFPKGLTLLDLKEETGHRLSLSELAARQEVRQLICAIAPEKIKGPVHPVTVEA